VFIAITLYLSRVVGFDDIEAGWIGGIFAAGLYFLPLLPVPLQIKLVSVKQLYLPFLF